jgi:5-methylthioadenosine/S-adenosylhomocysteine deaminase
MAPHAPYTVSEAHLLEAFNMAVEQDLPYHLHLHETKQEVTDSVEGNKTQFAHNSDQLCSPVVNLDRLGIMSSRTVAVHMTHVRP